jgi:hypothetical protein
MKPHPARNSWMQRIRAPRLAAFLALLLCAGAQAVEIHAARFVIQPERVYVNQPIEVRLEIEVSPGAEVQDVQVEGVPLDSFALLSPYQKEDRRQVRRGDRTVDVLPFTSAARAANPVRQTFNGVLRATVVERRSTGFFTSVSSATAAVRMDPLTLEFRPLPPDAPPGFQGAVGNFRLSAQLEPARAAPGDIVNLVCSLDGKGWLGTAQLLLPAADPLFRIYPPQEMQRDEGGRLIVKQVFVPLTTNAAQIAAVRFPYFDPAAGVYRVASAGPFHLQLVASTATSNLPAVKPFELQPLAATPSEIGDAAVAATVTQATRLLPFAGVFLCAVVVAGLLYGWRPRLALAAGVILFAAGVYLCQHGIARGQPHGRVVRELVTARLCPSPGARVLFHVSPGRTVTPLEISAAWVRIDSDGRRGWVPAASLQ